VNLFRKTVALGGDEERTRNSGEGWLALLVARGYLGESGGGGEGMGAFEGRRLALVTSWRSSRRQPLLHF